MPLNSAVVGTSTGSHEVAIDHRWLMSYAAGVPDERPELYDTDGDLAVHPLFPVAPEWALVIAQRAEGSGLTVDEVRRGIHIGHDLLLERPVPVGRIRLTATVVGVGRLRAGATQQTLLTATALEGEGDGEGDVLWRTLFTNLFLGVDLVGDPVAHTLDWPALPGQPASPHTGPVGTATSEVRTIDAHVYSECARIWNPIHTDVVAARAAGLAAPILHGTATLARSVSLATRLAGVPLASVRRVAGQFRAPVPLGSSVDVRLLGADDDHLWFDAVLPDGSTALANGVLGLSG